MESKPSSTSDALVWTVIMAIVVLFFLLPGVVALITFGVYLLLYRRVGLRWYWPLSVLLVCVGLVMIAPVSTLIPGTGYLWHLILGNVSQTLKSAPLPGGVSVSPITPIPLKSAFWAQVGDPKEYTLWPVVRSTLVVGIGIGSLAYLVWRYMRPQKPIPTNAERMEQQRAIKSRRNDYLVSQAEKRAAKRFGR